MRTTLALARLALLLAVAAPTAAADHIKLKDGSVVNGKATAYDSQKKTLSFRTDQGEDKTYTLVLGWSADTAKAAKKVEKGDDEDDPKEKKPAKPKKKSDKKIDDSKSTSDDAKKFVP